MKTHLLWCQRILIWFQVLSASHGIYSGDDLYSANTAMGKTKTVSSDFSSMVRVCLTCNDKKSSTTTTLHLPTEFKMQQENEKSTDTMETQTYFEHDNKDLDGMSVDNLVFGNWDIPIEGTKKEVSSSIQKKQRNKNSSDAEMEQLQLETGSMLTTFQLGQRKISSGLVHAQQELSNDDVWLGYQLGHKGRKASSSELLHQEPASLGMWFGLQRGKREKKSSDSEPMQQGPGGAGMWFGPRLGKRGGKSRVNLIQQEPTSLGMWFGPRLGKRGEKSSASELLQPQPGSASMWFGPWLGQRGKKPNNNTQQVKQESASEGMWFGRQLGKRTNKSSDSNHVQRESVGDGMRFGPWLGHRGKKSNYNDKQTKQDTLSGGMWFGPRLGRREKKDHINDEHVNEETVRGSRWFGPSLGQREIKSYDPEQFRKQSELWTHLETTGNRPPEYEFTP
jgi:hypothetical protein